MYTVTKRMEIAGSHKLDLPYESKCRNAHGHNWIVTVTCRRLTLDASGMVVDFTDIKAAVHDVLDHKHLNDVLPEGTNPTAENIARWICDRVPHCVKVEVQESEGNVATYEAE